MAPYGISIGSKVTAREAKSGRINFLSRVSFFSAKNQSEFWPPRLRWKDERGKDGLDVEAETTIESPLSTTPLIKT